MVIQRIQSLYLLAAAVIMTVLSLAIPVGEIVQEPARESITIAGSGMLHVLVINLLVAVLAFLAIFLFKNLKLQIKVTQISTVLAIAALALYLCAFVFFAPATFSGSPVLPIVMYCVAALCTYLAYRGEKRDYKAIHSDRLW